MSISPNDSFDNDFAEDADGQVAQSPQPKSKKGCLILVLVVFLLFLLICCGGGSVAVYYGMGQYSEVGLDQVQDDSVIVEYIGEVESFSMSISATMEAAEAVEQPGDQPPLAFEIKGSKSEGVLLLMPTEEDPTVFTSGTLVLPNGERIPLEVFEQPDDSADLNLDVDISDLVDEGDLSSGGTDDTAAAAEPDEDGAAAQPQASATEDAKETSPN